eukprot:TRINITY_DN20793_c0_g1_i1.p1 TRINITY_DN20793_c0_g1~~TRINITY_DN20793_c0_g1_i1.p1  ORF type:complete len:214 (+),score=27.33 TRINITY_DN20793_c0_g1_i1:369-1010(+)
MQLVALSPVLGSLQQWIPCATAGDLRAKKDRRGRAVSHAGVPSTSVWRAKPACPETVFPGCVVSKGRARNRIFMCMNMSEPASSITEQRAPALTATIAAALLLVSIPACAPDARADPRTTFQNTCAACHAGGGNVLGGPTLSLEDLQRNGVFESEPLYDIIYGGKRRMPGYGVGCQPKGQCTFGPRLSDEEIQDLASYIREQAELGWKIPSPQ